MACTAPFFPRTPATASTVRSAQGGFTLLELMIAVVIVAILAVVANATYREQVVRAHAADATAALSDGRHRMEQYILGQRTYVGGPCTTSRTVGSFAVVCATPTASAYTITATGSGATSGLVYSIDQNARQRTTAVPTGWPALPTGGAACWLFRKGDTC
ncbi:type IV pilus assembly protein PilE [Sphaerotilus hippei]|uniref:Type IV pilus assembly protein PilE n=1 Tax=Sphaerotilus hippei TaxID=744406 RepID=A0A318H8R3_9BURK|nr:type IV pilin protein [Sphaerotilus hippei]PXW96263.1 type IV pilus assembly protein PilE [Sphaerotilus hippei]